MKVIISALLAKAEIIAKFAHDLNFPPYWQENWDSFDECLIDVLEDGHLVEVHVVGPPDVHEDVKKLVEILSKIASEREGLSVHIDDQ